MQFRDLQAQYAALKPQIDEAVSTVLASGQYIGGTLVQELESQLADYVGVKHCITCGNGTDALQLALMAWGIGEGDAVFVRGGVCGRSYAGLRRCGQPYFQSGFFEA